MLRMTLETKVRLSGDKPAAASPVGLADRTELAFVAMERTRMPMCITDPRQPDNPIVLSNHAFLELTGYTAEEVIGRNCRFLQGPETDPAAVDELRRGIAEERETVVELINYSKDGTPFWNQLMVSPVHDEDGNLLYFFSSQLDISRRREAQDLEQSEHLLLREVDHRAKNALALVQGIVRLSRSDDPQVYARSVQGRVDALARAHAILAEVRWRDVPLERLIHAEVEPYGTRRVRVDGPAIDLPAAHVQPLALLLHEMLDNAAHHGALSTPQGTVTIRWEGSNDADLAISWVEEGGPPPAGERQPGFGVTMIDAIVRRQLRGRATFDWAPAGLSSQVVFRVEPQSAKPR
jgi:PAS domain S-box-containing protein